MAGGMGRRSGPTLGERLAASSASAPPPAQDREATRDRPVVTRHCWVSGVPDSPGRHAGLLAEWRHDRVSGQWLGRVVYAVGEHDRAVLVERWLPAEHLAPA